MKRSEMVEVIRTAMREGYIKPDEILDVVEKAGMLPPPIEVIIECNRGERKFKRNKWEEEE